ncbi:gh regulated tbc protein-1, putative [Schistosoma mansoni]|uniref:gh regulated tbc protein-1, putative n=1 Tax=Schistosoma mansoni TaxID=6183 RepID=UPI00022C83F3|nr:gh regulated tbc protein-1, putative [Schistosoma mansoni]|eukprot:XP_018645331.1 gh regulated tbc protein-1, putative [Schistosoma mansoni]
MSSVEEQKFPDRGFESPEYVEGDEYSDFVQTYESVLQRRVSRWEKYFSTLPPKKSARFKRFCRKGIPDHIRPTVWMHLSGAYERMEANPDAYQIAVSKVPPTNIWNVILAAAVLLLVLDCPPNEREVKAFWLLDALINHILPKYYSSDMLAVRVDCMVFNELLKDKIPTVHKIIMNSGITCTLLATKWFICLFADVLPIETTIRVFDCLFYEGDKVLFRVCLSLVRLHYKDLIQCNEFPVLITAFRNMCKDKQTLYCHQFVESMFRSHGSLPKSKIAKLRNKFTQQLENDGDPE